MITDSAHFDGKSYPCDQCEYKAKQKQNLQRHVNIIHLGIKNYYCDHCDDKFATKNNNFKIM